jgi:nitroreductase
MTTDLYDALMTTRAMRRFTLEPVADEDIRACLRAAVQAPSGGNIQPYQFLVVTDAARRAEIARVYRKAWDRYAPAVAATIPPAKDQGAQRRHDRNVEASDALARTLADVPVHVLILMPKISMVVTDDEDTMDVGPPYASVYPAVQNLILAARRDAPAGGVAHELGPLRRSAQVALTGGASRLRRGSHILRARGDRFAAPTAVYSVTERRSWGGDDDHRHSATRGFISASTRSRRPCSGHGHRGGDPARRRRHGRVGIGHHDPPAHRTGREPVDGVCADRSGQDLLRIETEHPLGAI